MSLKVKICLCIKPKKVYHDQVAPNLDSQDLRDKSF
jgi:hypothetical protein